MEREGQQMKAKSNALMMMLKSFGIDPEELQKQGQLLIEGVKQQQQLILDSLARIEKKLEEMESCQKEERER